jgi:hypothetical protein
MLKDEIESENKRIKKNIVIVNSILWGKIQ